MNCLYLTNKIPHLKERFITFFSYSEISKLDCLKEIQQTYDLPEIYFFRTFDELKGRPLFIGISLKSLDWRRTEKILSAANSENLKEFQKYKKTRISICNRNSIIEYFNKLETEPKKCHLSKGHYDLLKEWKVPLCAHENFHSHGNAVEITHGVLTEKQ